MIIVGIVENETTQLKRLVHFNLQHKVNVAYLRMDPVHFRQVRISPILLQQSHLVFCHQFIPRFYNKSDSFFTLVSFPKYIL